MTSSYIDEISQLKFNISIKEKEVESLETKRALCRLEFKMNNSSDVRRARLAEADQNLMRGSHELATMRRELAAIEDHLNVRVSINEAAKPEVGKRPPFIAEAISRLATKPSLRDRVLGSREARFHRDLLSRSEFAARAIYWCDTIASCWPGVRRLFLWLLTGDVMRRWFGS